MTQRNRVHIRIRCFECGEQVGWYEVTEGVALDEIPLPGDFICNPCRDKQIHETEKLT